MPAPDSPLFFDAEADVTVTQGHLPHWEQAGTVCFVTFRTWDSMPREVVERLRLARDGWLGDHGIDTRQPDWEQRLGRLRPHEQAEFRRVRSDRWERALDDCCGSCPLRRPALARIVADSLLHFDGDRYRMFDFVVMPNHVHVLAGFAEPDTMRKQCASWKHFTATRLNAALVRKGRFWEDESFDHLVRAEAQFWRLRRYIAANPGCSKLTANEFVHYSRDIDGLFDRVTPLAERADHSSGANA